MLLQEVSCLHCPLQQCLVPQNSSYTSIGWEHQTWGQWRENWFLSWQEWNTFNTFWTGFFHSHFYINFLFQMLFWKKGSLWVYLGMSWVHKAILLYCHAQKIDSLLCLKYHNIHFKLQLVCILYNIVINTCRINYMLYGWRTSSNCHCFLRTIQA